MRWLDFLPMLISFAITAIALAFLIPFLRRHKAQQVERDYVLEEHLKKTGTPTMGGAAFLLAIVVVGIIFGIRHPGVWPILILTVGFGAVGFYDDYLKVTLRRPEGDGLDALPKLLMQLGVTAAFLIILKVMKIPMTLRVPFAAGKMISFGWFAYPFLFLVVLATVNGVNITDGLDGLCGSVTSAVAVFFAVAAVLLKSDILPMPLAVFGGLLAFLMYNSYPAKIFMGDTGSLALGGFVAGTAYLLQMPLFILVVGLVYAVEEFTAALQMGYFKISHGKRLLPMAPIHHTFEIWGWSETRIVTVFTVVTCLLCVLALRGLV